MLKIEGLDKLSKQLEEAQRAFAEIDGELGTVSFNPHDPESIETAIREVYALVDTRLGGYASNPIVSPMIDQMKESYRESIVERAAAARIEGTEE